MELECKKCGKAFIPCKGLKSFCSMKCRSSRQFSEETKKKKAISFRKWWDSLTLEQKVEFRKNTYEKSRVFDPEYRKQLHIKQKEINDKKPWDQIGFSSKRHRVIKQQNNCCAECGISEWRGVSIVLEIDHIDGNSSNDTRQNLKALCPNCHSITPTWRGRNNQSGKNKVSDDVLLTALKETDTIRLALLKVGLTAKGSNYERAKRLKESIDKSCHH